MIITHAGCATPRKADLGFPRHAQTANTPSKVTAGLVNDVEEVNRNVPEFIVHRHLQFAPFNVVPWELRNKRLRLGRPLPLPELYLRGDG